MKKIEFIPINSMTEKIIDPPVPAASMVPSWFKDLNVFMDQSIKTFRKPNGRGNLSAKSCVPILDAMVSGYMITLPCDITFVDTNVYGHRAIWDVSWQVLEQHVEEQTQNIGLPEIYEPSALKFLGLWRIKAPKGYSLLYTHPFYHFDLPFITTTGVVDSDVYDTAMNLPFFIRKDFVGVLKKGTPIAQVIPIKRENWKSQIEKYDPDYQFAHDNIKLVSSRSYKNRFWNKKSYH
jgi:hypothetical protein